MALRLPGERRSGARGRGGDHVADVDAHRRDDRLAPRWAGWWTYVRAALLLAEIGAVARHNVALAAVARATVVLGDAAINPGR
jgi:hypothetical protein